MYGASIIKSICEQLQRTTYFDEELQLIVLSKVLLQPSAETNLKATSAKTRNPIIAIKDK